MEEPWSIGIDLGGTKLEVARVAASGRILQRLRTETNIEGGAAAVINDITHSALALRAGTATTPVGVGVGVAGQVERDSGMVTFAPNLEWRNVPLRAELGRALALPVIVTNDVRAATWGEWLFGAGRGCDDLLCLFVGTGIGGGVVSDGKLLAGCSNTAGEFGHIIVDLNGPLCGCGNRGCLEALAGGRAIARNARALIAGNPDGGSLLLGMAGGLAEQITAATVVRAARAGDQLAQLLLDRATAALIAGAVSLINAFNPRRFILGGGVIAGIPELVGRIERGIHSQALAAATAPLTVLPAELQSDAGIIGAAALAFRTFAGNGVQEL